MMILPGTTVYDELISMIHFDVILCHRSGRDLLLQVTILSNMILIFFKQGWLCYSTHFIYLSSFDVAFKSLIGTLPMLLLILQVLMLMLMLMLVLIRSTSIASVPITTG